MEQMVVAEALTMKGFSRAAVEDLAAAREEPQWLCEWRRAAWETYEALPMPTRQDEDWRRTDIRGLELAQYTPVPGDGRVDAAAVPVLRPLATRAADLAGLLVQQDGALVSREVLDTVAGQRVLFTTLDAAVREHGDLVRRYLGSVVPAAANKFAALNAACWNAGSFVYVPPGVAIALPLVTLQWQESAGAALLPRTLVVLERGASLTLIADLRSNDQEAAAFHNGVVELYVGEGARLRYVGLQRWGRHVWNFTTERAVLGRDARLEWVVGALGARLTKTYLQAALREPGATARLVGVVYGDAAQHFDHHTLQEHVARHTASDLLFKTALKDRARSVFVGLIRVHKTAQQTDSYLANRNLLLSNTAKADSIPKLEIEANDVRCTHGATVSPVDPEQLFYLRTRGLSAEEAERMIVAGFFEPILEEIPAESVRERLRAALAAKMA
jgi:Fe-S cluster assembly protein SufD